MYAFKLPDLGEGIHEGEILKWHVQPGDTLREDDPLVDVETDKAAVTIPSPKGGRIATLNGTVGQSVKVGTVLAVIDDGVGTAGAAAGEQKLPPAVAATPGWHGSASPRREAMQTHEGSPLGTGPSTASPLTGPLPPSAAAAKPGGAVLAAPATRRLARELGVDITQVPGTGPAGRVTPEDVKRRATGGAPVPAAEGEAEPAPGARLAAGAPTGIPFFELERLPNFEEWGPVERQAVRSIRRKVARKMVTSMGLVPHVAHMDEADITDLEAFRRKEKERRAPTGDAPLTLLSFVMKAVTAGLRESPAFNASLDPFREEIIYKKFYNVGFAADTGKGLVVPVVKNTDRKSIRQIALEVAVLAAKAREEKLEVADLRGGTFTITNVGAIGGTSAVPTINYPEVAILAMGRAEPKPVVRDGQIVVRTMLPLTLTFDHRVIDGADAARFVNALRRRLEDPLAMLLDM